MTKKNPPNRIRSAIAVACWDAAVRSARLCRPRSATFGGLDADSVLTELVATSGAYGPGSSFV